ncbi:hypothetical protein BDF20DRAFT_837186 [Mycotypha africana]|uniref:uncharacterized protein n=1 Tax=Mycotypha africana TaxID=64632 RepID=UPI002300AC7C|nr:uncharacterized protein BDF20DRAFT_837186 [Mycotypha africana]KAI8973220.1 hypothetical protein BDF20DRAFT_837186 [Mycotypha africana]
MLIMMLLGNTHGQQQASSNSSLTTATMTVNAGTSQRYTIKDHHKEEEEAEINDKPTKTLYFDSLPSSTTTIVVLTTSLPSLREKDPLRQRRPHIIFSSFVLMFSGVFMLSFGFPFFRITMALVGGAVGCVICWTALQAREPINNYPNSDNLYFGVCLSAAVILAIVFINMYKVGLYSLCIVSGILFPLYICCWREDFLIQNFVHRSLFTLVFMLLFLLGLIFLEFATVIVSMALLGSYLFIVGLDLIIRTGFNTGLTILLDFNDWRNKHSTYHLNLLSKRNAMDEYHPDDWRVRTMLGSVLGITILSILFQRWYNRGNRFGLRIVRNSNDTLHKHK